MLSIVAGRIHSVQSELVSRKTHIYTYACAQIENRIFRPKLSLVGVLAPLPNNQ